MNEVVTLRQAYLLSYVTIHYHHKGPTIDTVLHLYIHSLLEAGIVVRINIYVVY